ncbi:MAG: hypothetical protein AAFR38_14085 [Planctomycetota bacterium]
MNGTTGQTTRRRLWRSSRRGFTAVDLLVTLFVVGVLMAIMLPAMRGVHEASKRLVCSSNLRQTGLAMVLYADDHNGHLPYTQFVDGPAIDKNPLDTVIVRAQRAAHGIFPDVLPDQTDWDGLGLLVMHNYLSTGEVLYCPAHDGPHPFERYADAYLDRYAPGAGEIVGNYQYRGAGPNRERRLAQIDPMASLASDGFRTLDELNHRDGFNVLNAALAVRWTLQSPTELATIAESVASEVSTGGGGNPTLSDPWKTLDREGEREREEADAARDRVDGSISTSVTLGGFGSEGR